MKNIIVISAHPDDETIGMAGTILKHKASGDNIVWLIATEILSECGYTDQAIAYRKIEIDKVAKAYDFTKVYRLGYPTMTLSGTTLIKMVPQISSIFNEVKPEVVYCVNRSDAHSDHRILFDAVMSCTKSFRYPFIEKVLMYECLSETEFAPALPEKVFIPNYFTDITDYLERKLEIMKIYASELGQHPFPRSLRAIEALATLRGSVAGVEYAEAFQTIRIIDR